MVDRKERDKLAGMLQTVLDGKAAVEDVEGEYAGAVAPTDPAILAVIDRVLWIAGRKRPGYGPRGEITRQALERAIAFLRTSQDYSWDKSARMSWWMVPIAVVAVLGGLVISCFLGESLKNVLARLGVAADEFACTFLPVLFLAAVLLVLFEWLPGRLRGRDASYWPFFGRKEYEAAWRG